MFPPPSFAVSCPYTVSSAFVAHATWPLFPSLSRWYAAPNVPLNIPAVPPPPPSTTIPILPILPILLAPRPAPPRPAPRSPERFENGQDCDERNPKPDADLSIANQTDVYGTTVIVPAMFIETARRPRYARLIGSLMSGPNERRSSKRALAP